MKKLFAFLSAVIVSLTAVCITASAVEDIELSVTRAVATNGLWGQSITYSSADFNPMQLTPDSQILVEYEIDGEMPTNGYHPAELIFQNYVAEPALWVQIRPAEFDEDSAVFNYEDILAYYTDKGGAADFSDVNNICIGDCGVVVKVTKVTATNCERIETTTTAASEEEVEEETVTESETTAAPAETTAAQTTAPEKADSSSDSNIVTIVIIIAVVVVVIAAVIVVVVVVKNNRRRFY